MYLHLVEDVGVDRAFSPRVAAVSEIQHFLHEGPIRHMGALAVGIADVYEVRVPIDGQSAVTGKPLKEVQFPAKAMVAAIGRGAEVCVPGGDDVITSGDTVLVIGPGGIERELRKAFGIR